MCSLDCLKLLLTVFLSSIKSNLKQTKGKKDKTRMSDKTKMSVQLNSAFESAALMMNSMKPFSKSFYREDSSISEMSEADVKQHREQLQLHICTYKNYLNLLWRSIKLVLLLEGEHHFKLLLHV